jgi:hypothetical protein
MTYPSSYAGMSFEDLPLEDLEVSLAADDDEDEEDLLSWGRSRRTSPLLELFRTFAPGLPPAA